MRVLLRERVLLPRGFAELLRVFVAAPEALLARDPAAFLRAPLARVDADVADFARVDAGLRPVLFAREAVEPALRRLLDFRARALPELAEALDVEVLLAPADPSSDVHFPVSTRCAASATASAISDPSLVALVITLVAA